MANLTRSRIAWIIAVIILALSPTSMAQNTGTLSGAIADRTHVNPILGGPDRAASGTRLAEADRITMLASAPWQAQLGVKFVW
jgi:hypothetical protein